MDNQVKNKLVIASGPGFGWEFHFVQERATIGSAPGNDVQIDRQDVSGFHAELRIENNTYYISDFSSENGTFVNEESVLKEKQVNAGDCIRIGSTSTVFIPRNAILLRENSHSMNFNDDTKRLSPDRKKWLIMAFIFLALMVAIKAAIGKNKSRQAQQNPSIAQNSRINDAVHSGEGVNVETKKQSGSTAIAVRKRENDGQNNMPNEALGESAGNRHIRAKDRRQDNLADTYFAIANKFSDYQLWQDALAHYQKVSEQNPTYPELSGKIAQMQSEIYNQAAYQRGQALIKNGSYEDGIARLQHIDANSFYYHQAVKVIADAEKQITQSK